MGQPASQDVLGANPYIDGIGRERTQQAIAAGGHRGVIGGLWEEAGQLQLDFLVSQGLLPGHRLLDVGCGSFRAGVKLIPFLEPGNYYGLDAVEGLLEAGYRHEIMPNGLDRRFPRANMRANEVFDATMFGVLFEAALAQSVFTHMPLVNLRTCLEQLAPVMAPGGRFFVTYFLRPEGVGEAPVRHAPGRVVSYPDRDPYDATLNQLAAQTPSEWSFTNIGDWGHPRAQQMAIFERA